MVARVSVSERARTKAVSRWADVVRVVSAHPGAALLIAATVLAVASMPTHGFTYNEIMHIGDGVVDLPTPSWVVTLANREIHGPFYAVVAWVLLAAGADSEIPYRLVSVVCYAAAVAVAYLLAKDALGRRGALFAGAFVATHPFVLLFAHLFVRYDLHLLLGLLATRQLLRQPAARGWPAALLFGVWLAAGMLNLFTLGFVLPAFALVWLLTCRTSPGRFWTPVAGAAACLAVAAVYLPTLLAPPTHHGKSPVDASMVFDLLALFGGINVLVPVLALVGWRVARERVRPAALFRFTSDDTPWLGVHLLLAVVPIVALVLFSVVVMPCTDPWYALPCVASAAVVLGALYEGSPRWGRVILLVVLAIQATSAVPSSRHGNPMVIHDVDLFATTTELLEGLPDRSTPVFVTPASIALGVELYHQRDGRGDLTLVTETPAADNYPDRFCVLRWTRLFREDALRADASRGLGRDLEVDPSSTVAGEDVELVCYRR